MYLLRKFKDTLCKSVWVRKLTDRLLLSRFASFPAREGDISCRDLHQVAVCPVGPLREGLKKSVEFFTFFICILGKIFLLESPSIIVLKLKTKFFFAHLTTVWGDNPGGKFHTSFYFFLTLHLSHFVPRQPVSPWLICPARSLASFLLNPVNNRWVFMEIIQIFQD